MVGLAPEEGERRLVEEALPARWLVDGDDTRGVEGLISLWPRRELREAGKTWQDFPDLRWLKVVTAGVNHVPWRDVPDHVQVLSTPGSSAPAIAEYVLGGVIAWGRGFLRHTRDMAAGRFELGAPTRAVAEMRVGTLGHGAVGQAVASALAGQGARVRAVSRSGRKAPGSPVEDVDTSDGLPRLASWADVLVVCLPLRHETVGLVDGKVLEALGDGLLVNVARGPIVVQEDLHTWLAQGRDRGAVLDVWWGYRDQPYEAPLQDHDVIMTPHNSSNTTGYRQRMLEQALADVKAHMRDGRLRHVEDRRWYA